MSENTEPAVRAALTNLLNVLYEKIEGGPHPWIPGACFHDDVIEEAITEARAVLELPVAEAWPGANTDLTQGA